MSVGVSHTPSSGLHTIKSSGWKAEMVSRACEDKLQIQAVTMEINLCPSPARVGVQDKERKTLKT